tara:strand:+ start:624 stop:1523 length:900 start_codon:yes stop_codon:yes gene_type:complete
MNIYIKLFEVLFPVFFIIGIGYFLGKKDPKINTNFITKFTANIGFPGLVFYSLTGTGLTFNDFQNFFIYGIILISSFSIIGIIFLFFMRKDIIRNLPPYILPNTGNMGLPICLFAYGNHGFGLASSIGACVILGHFTLNIFLAQKRFDFSVILKSIPFYSVIFSAFWLYFEFEAPNFILNTTMLLTYTTIFLVLMSLGIALTRLKVFSIKESLIGSIARLVFGPIIGFIIIKIFDLTGYAAGIILIQSSMPSAVLTYLVGSMYSPKKIVDEIASMIVVTTIFSFITIPLVVFFALKYFI